MNTNYKHILQPKSILILGMLLLLYAFSIAQQQQTKLQTPQTPKPESQIVILDNVYGEILRNDTLTVQILVGNVKLLHDADTIYCDSAVVYEQLLIAEAYGDVWIRQSDGTNAMADYMRYTGKTKSVAMKGNVQLVDKDQNELWSEIVTYNLNTKIGTYANGGTLISKETIIQSKEATYNLKTKDARFKRDVIINDPEYHVVSTDLGYNTETDIVKFFGPSVVTNENNLMQTTSGIYNAKTKTSHFDKRTSIFDDGMYIEGDSLDYDEYTGYAIAKGNVIAIDTAEKMYLYAEHATYNEQTKKMISYGQPVIKRISDEDTFYYRADTFLSGTVVKVIAPLSGQDSVNKTIENILENKAIDTLIASEMSVDDFFTDFKDTTIVKTPVDSSKIKSTNFLLPTNVDTITYSTRKGSRGVVEDKLRSDSNFVQNTITNKDTVLKSNFVFGDSVDVGDVHWSYNTDTTDTAKRYFIGYYNVRIYSDSIQGKSDSMYYNQLDSLVKMIKDPVLWSGDRQMTGDTIIMLMDSSRLRELYIPRNATLISRSGPEKAGFYDQIQGNTLRAFMNDSNNIDSMHVFPSAQNIYYAQDEEDAYLGVNETTSDRMEIIFENKEISGIYYRGITNGTTTPMTMIDPVLLKLSRFQWREKEKKESLSDFLDGKSINEPQLWRDRIIQINE